MTSNYVRTCCTRTACTATACCRPSRCSEKLDVLNVDAGIDYRKRALEQVQAYHTPLGREAAALRDAFVSIAGTADESPILHIEHREIKALRKAGGVVWFDFATLCGGPRSQNDYLEIASSSTR
jgi:cell division protein ZapE